MIPDWAGSQVLNIAVMYLNLLELGILLGIDY